MTLRQRLRYLVLGDPELPSIRSRKRSHARLVESAAKAIEHRKQEVERQKREMRTPPTPARLIPFGSAARKEF